MDDGQAKKKSAGNAKKPRVSTVAYVEKADDDDKLMKKYSDASKLVNSSSIVAQKLNDKYVVPDAKYWNVNYATQLLKGTIRIASCIEASETEKNILLNTIKSYLEDGGFISSAVLYILQSIFMMKEYIEYSPIPFIKSDINFYLNTVFSLTDTSDMCKQISYRLTYATAVISFISKRTMDMTQTYGLKGSKKRRAFIQEDTVYDEVKDILSNLKNVNRDKGTAKLSRKAFSLPGITQTDQTELNLSLIDSIMYAIAPLSQSGKHILFEFIGAMIVLDTLPSKYCRVISGNLVLNSTMETRMTYQNAVTELMLRLPEAITNAMTVGKV